MRINDVLAYQVLLSLVMMEAQILRPLWPRLPTWHGIVQNDLYDPFEPFPILVHVHSVLPKCALLKTSLDVFGRVELVGNLIFGKEEKVDDTRVVSTGGNVGKLIEEEVEPVQGQCYILWCPIMSFWLPFKGIEPVVNVLAAASSDSYVRERLCPGTVLHV